MDSFTKEYVRLTLNEERLWKEGEEDSFQFGAWTITLRKKNFLGIYKYEVEGIRENGANFNFKHNTMESAMLHIVNNFVQADTPKCNSITEWLRA